MKVVEELCQDPDCEEAGTHGHPFTVEAFIAQSAGPYPAEYTVTLRVRDSKPRKVVSR